MLSSENHSVTPSDPTDGEAEDTQHTQMRTRGHEVRGTTWSRTQAQGAAGAFCSTCLYPQTPVQSTARLQPGRLSERRRPSWSCVSPVKWDRQGEAAGSWGGEMGSGGVPGR